MVLLAVADIYLNGTGEFVWWRGVCKVIFVSYSTTVEVKLVFDNFPQDVQPTLNPCLIVPSPLLMF